MVVQSKDKTPRRPVTATETLVQTQPIADPTDDLAAHLEYHREMVDWFRMPTLRQEADAAYTARNPRGAAADRVHIGRDRRGDAETKLTNERAPRQDVAGARDAWVGLHLDRPADGASPHDGGTMNTKPVKPLLPTPYPRGTGFKTVDAKDVALAEKATVYVYHGHSCYISCIPPHFNTDGYDLCPDAGGFGDSFYFATCNTGRLYIDLIHPKHAQARLYRVVVKVTPGKINGSSRAFYVARMPQDTAWGSALGNFNFSAGYLVNRRGHDKVTRRLRINRWQVEAQLRKSSHIRAMPASWWSLVRAVPKEWLGSDSQTGDYIDVWQMVGGDGSEYGRAMWFAETADHHSVREGGRGGTGQGWHILNRLGIDGINRGETFKAYMNTTEVEDITDAVPALNKFVLALSRKRKIFLKAINAA